MDSYKNVLGYMKYTGKLVDEGFLDARKSANSLLNFDEAIRYFIKQSLPDLDKFNYEIPVKIQKGSWEAIIPDTIAKWIVTGTGIALTKYLTTAATELAKNDFEEASIKKAFTKAIQSIQWFIKIAKHIGHFNTKKIDKVKFRNNNKEIGIPNTNQDYLYVPKEFLDIFSGCSPKLLEAVAQIVEFERELSFGVFIGGSLHEETIKQKDKLIFCEEEQDDVLFPELVHGQYVELEGDITRGNENSNNLGFRYDGHILTILPATGSIVKHKRSLFLKCIVKGNISRLDKFGFITEKRPKIVFSDIIPIELEDDNLFKKP